MKNLEFIKSARFWKLFIVAVLEFLGAQEIIPKELAHGFALWLLGSVGVRTIDRFSEKLTPNKTE